MIFVTGLRVRTDIYVLIVPCPPHRQAVAVRFMLLLLYENHVPSAAPTFDNKYLVTELVKVEANSLVDLSKNNDSSSIGCADFVRLFHFNLAHLICIETK